MASKRRKRKSPKGRSSGKTVCRRPDGPSASWKSAGQLSDADRRLLGQAQQAETSGQTARAIQFYEQLLLRHPRSVPLLNSLAMLYTVQADNERALDLYDRALAEQPDDAILNYNRAIVLEKMSRWRDAAAAYEATVTNAPQRLADLPLRLAKALVHSNQQDRAIERIEQLTAEMPGFQRGLLLGQFYDLINLLDKARAAYQLAVDSKPDSTHGHIALAMVLRRQGELLPARQHLEQAMELDPNDFGALNNLAMMNAMTGEMHETVALYRRAVAAKPDHPGVHSNLLMNLNYLDDAPPEEIAAEHRLFGQRHGRPGLTFPSHPNDPSPDRRIRVGFVSADFRMHSVAYFFEPLLDHMDRSAVEMIGYGQVERPDRTTQRFARKFDRYVPIIAMTDEILAQRVHRDQVDILVDLTGHTGNNRLRTFAMKPAPVQAFWLGYANTTGLEQIDYYITDEIAGAPACEPWFAETLLRLPRGFHCYRPPEDAPDVAELPALQSGQITFGCFNREYKIQPGTARLWAQILAAVPHSRLLLKGGCTHDETATDCLKKMLVDCGVAPDRLMMVSWQSTRTEHLAKYNEVDITLDCYPYNGTTTTCESLWMGVPVVTRSGGPYCSRVGASLLRQVGLEFFATTDEQEYVAKAVALASKPEALAKIRQTLRARMQSSWLRDEAGFARQFEQALRQMWTTWCATKGARAGASA